MELNEKTLKEGMTLYYLYVVQSKYYERYWKFNISEAKIRYLEKDRNCQYYSVGFEIPWSNELIVKDERHYQYKNGQLWNVNFIGNDKPFLKLKEYKGTYENEWAFLCVSFRDLAQILKQTLFNGKGNEVTKKKRLRIYRELVKQWTKSFYRNNFQVVIR